MGLNGEKQCIENKRFGSESRASKGKVNATYWQFTSGDAWPSQNVPLTDALSFSTAKAKAKSLKCCYGNQQRAMFMFCPPDETHDPPQPLAAAAKKKVFHRWSACLFSDHRTSMRGRQRQRGGWGVARELLHKREIIIISRLPISVLTLLFSALVAFALKKKNKEYYK